MKQTSSEQAEACFEQMTFCFNELSYQINDLLDANLPKCIKDCEKAGYGKKKKKK